MEQEDRKTCEKWLNIVDYASHKRMSISTIRRYIKAKRLKYKMEGGRYYILTKLSTDIAPVLDPEKEMVRLKKENRQLKEQLAEMEMLVNLYESNQENLGRLLKTERNQGPPAVPNNIKLC